MCNVKQPGVSLWISLLDCFDLILGHIHGTEYKIKCLQTTFSTSLTFITMIFPLPLPASEYPSSSVLRQLPHKLLRTRLQVNYLKPRVILKQIQINVCPTIPVPPRIPTLNFSLISFILLCFYAAAHVRMYIVCPLKYYSNFKNAILFSKTYEIYF